MGGHGRAYRRAHRRSCRSGRSSEPGSEAGTRPRDGQDRTLECARPLGTTRGCPLDPITLWMVLTLPARMYEPISRETHAQTIPHRTRITGICGSRRVVLESKCSSPGSSNGRGARCGGNEELKVVSLLTISEIAKSVDDQQHPEAGPQRTRLSELTASVTKANGCSKWQAHQHSNGCEPGDGLASEILTGTAHLKVQSRQRVHP